MQWTIGLRDALSGPAKAIKQALSGVGDAFKTVRADAQHSQAAMDATFGSSLSGLKSQFEMFKGTDLGMVMSGGASVAVSAIAAVATAVAAVTVALGAMAAAATVAFAKTAIQAGIFRENNLISLEVLLKDKTAALRVYRDAVKMAADTPFETTDMISLYQKLLSVGFKEGDLKQVATALGDMAASKGMDKQLMDQLANAFGRLNSGKGLSAEVLNMFTEAGVRRTDIVGQISKIMGKSSDEVEKLLSQGKISSDVAQKAILTVVENTFGGTMAKLAKTLSGLWSSLVSRPFEALNEAFETKGGLHAWYEELKKSVGWLGEKFDPTKEQGQKIIGFINLFGSGLRAITQILSGFGKGLFEGLAKGLPNLKGKEFGDAEQIAKGFQVLGEAIGTVIGYMVSGAAAVTEFVATHKTLLTVVLIVAAAFGVVVAAIGAAIAAIASVVGGLVLLAGAFVALIPTVIGVGVGIFVVWSTAVVAAILGAVYAIYAYWDDITAFWAETVSKMTLVLSAIAASVTGFGASMYGAAYGLGTSFRDGVVGAIQSAAGAIRAAMQAALDTTGLSVIIPGISPSGGGGPPVAPSPSPSTETAPSKQYNGESSVSVRSFVPSGETTKAASSTAPNISFNNCTFGAGSETTIKTSLEDAFATILLQLGRA